MIFVRRPSLWIATAASALILTACGQDKPQDSAAQPTAAGETAQAPAANAPFDLSAVPMSTVALGAFPYLRLPDGYREMNAETQDFAEFPYWTGARFEMIEGQVHQAILDVESGKTFSRLELLRNLQNALAAAGAVKVFDGQIPEGSYSALPEALQSSARTGLAGSTNAPTETWVIRQADRTVWVHLFVGSESGAWAVTEVKSMVQTAGLLPADQLAQKINADGRVAISVNFDVDKSAILPNSQPQIDAVAQLLAAQPNLRLSVEGHTDESGSAAHNQTLSESRARAVVAALTGKGVAPDRLQARGFGDARPVGDNASDDGRARNRRVELVRL